MFNKIIFGSLWLGFSGYAFLLAPPDSADSLQLIINLSTGKWAGIDPFIIALFNLMGILPMVYACLMLIDGKNQRLSAGLFSAASFAVGAFAILPYLALRESNSTTGIDRIRFNGVDRRGIIKLVDSRWLGVSLTIGTVILLGYGIKQGNWTDFVQQWHSSRFIHVMSLDFCMLSLLFPWLLGDDMQRRGMSNERFFTFIALVPLVGALIYLCLRSPLHEEEQTTTTSEA